MGHWFLKMKLIVFTIQWNFTTLVRMYIGQANSTVYLLPPSYQFVLATSFELRDT